MKGLSLLFCMVAMTGMSSASWETDYETAINRAKAEQKLILVNFSADDRCRICRVLETNVLSTAEFRRCVESEFVCLKIDCPSRRGGPDRETLDLNRRIRRAYGITGFPTIMVLDEDGIPLVTRRGYCGTPSPETYAAGLLDETSRALHAGGDK